MKKIICLLTVLAMVFSLAACGGSGSGDKNDGPKDGEIAATGSKWVEGLYVPELENTNIRWLRSSAREYHQSIDTEEIPDAYYQSWLAWEATYGGKVTVEVTGWDDFTTYLTTGAASGDMPDIVYGGTTWFPKWPAAGLVQPLDDYADYIDLSDEMWNKGIMDQLKWGGKNYIAYAQVPELFYICYNQTKFDLAGEKTPLEHWKDGTWTWTQFIKTAKNMTDVKANEYGYTGWNLGVNKSPYSLINIADDGTLTSNVTNTKVKNYFQSLYDFTHSGAQRTDNSSSNYMSTFFAGQDAMIHVSQEEYIRKQKMLKITGGDEFRIAPNPLIDSNNETQSKMSSNIYGYSISSQAKNPEGAAVLINLYYKIHNKIEDSNGELGSFGVYLNDEEKAAVKQANEAVPELNFTIGISNFQALWAQSKCDFITDPAKEGSVSSALDGFDSVLNAELKEVMKAVGQ